MNSNDELEIVEFYACCCFSASMVQSIIKHTLVVACHLYMVKCMCMPNFVAHQMHIKFWIVWNSYSPWVIFESLFFRCCLFRGYTNTDMRVVSLSVHKVNASIFSLPPSLFLRFYLTIVLFTLRFFQTTLAKYIRLEFLYAKLILIKQYLLTNATTNSI